MTHRLMISVAALALMAATGFAKAQDTGTQEPKIKTLSTKDADGTADRTTGQNAKSDSRDVDSDLAAAVRIDQQMSNESVGKTGRRRRH